MDYHSPSLCFYCSNKLYKYYIFCRIENENEKALLPTRSSSYYCSISCYYHRNVPPRTHFIYSMDMSFIYEAPQDISGPTSLFLCTHSGAWPMRHEETLKYMNTNYRILYDDDHSRYHHFSDSHECV